MEAKEKAKELVEKFRQYAKIGADAVIGTRTENAKACAIICCDEIKKEVAENIVDMSKEAQAFQWDRLNHWQEIKEQIESI